MANLTHSIYFRYWFFQWLFKDVNVRELYQRAAAVRHNVANRHYLLTYLRRWFVLTVGMFGLGVGLEQAGTLACVFFYTVAALSACSITKIIAAYVLMGKLTP